MWSVLAMLCTSTAFISLRSNHKHRVLDKLFSARDHEPILRVSDVKLQSFKHKIVSLGSPKILPPIKPGADWQLWHHVRDSSFSDDIISSGTGRIVHATSKDGLTDWLYESKPVLDPSKECGDWFLFDAEHVGLGELTCRK